MMHTGIVTANRLNIRTDASTAGEPIGQLARGARVRIVGQAGPWWEIDLGGQRAFIHGDFLTLLDDAPAAGFLHEHEEMQRLPLEPPESERVRTNDRAGSMERGLAAAWNAAGGLLMPLSDALSLPPSVAVSVLYVESGGRGFGPDGRMIIRFENHVFWRRWGESDPGRFNSHFRFDDARPWQAHRFRALEDAPWTSCHTDQDCEWRVFDFARTLSDASALFSISMGSPQIMGFNHAVIGYGSPRSMFERFQSDLRYQILGLFDFLKGPGTSSPMLQALRRGQWEEFATRYNGPGQAAAYGARIAGATRAFERLSV